MSTMTLSPREAEVAEIAARGYSHPYIAQSFGLSLRTIETHVFHIYKKLGLNTKDELISYFSSGVNDNKPPVNPELLKTYTCWGNNKQVHIRAINEREAQAECMQRYGWYPMAIQQGEFK